METIKHADYIQYGFPAFIGLLLVVMLVALLRQARDIGQPKGDVQNITRRIGDVRDHLSGRIERLEAAVAALGQEITEVKGTLLS